MSGKGQSVQREESILDSNEGSFGDENITEVVYDELDSRIEALYIISFTRVAGRSALWKTKDSLSWNSKSEIGRTGWGRRHISRVQNLPSSR